jgi:pimeloyl-ACP methyl ester carboxylesterase
MSTQVEGPAGRSLRVYEAGDPAGPMVLAHHGTPADGQLFAPWARDAEARGMRLVSYDRPGYGGSTPHEGRRVADAAADAAAIADALGVERFATWGISGGGPHALACAALLPDRVVGVASLAGVAPFDAPGLNYFSGMGHDNIVEFGAAMQGREAIEPMARAMAEEMVGATPEGLIDLMRTLVSPPDVAVLGAELGAYWAACMPEVFRQGAVGWIDDDLVFLEPFGFDIADIAAPALVWHGRHDLFVPVAHGEWLARAIPGAEARITIDDGHLTLIANRIPAVHEWLLARF